MIEEILEIARQAADAAEVYYVSYEETPVSFEANRLKALETKETSGAAMRLIKNGRIGFASSTDLRNPRLIVDMALAVARFGAEARFQFPHSAIAREVPVYDPLVEGLTPQAMVEMGHEMLHRMQEYDDRILCEVGIGKTMERVRLMNTAGGNVAYQKTALSGGIGGNLTRDTDMLEIYESASSCQFVTGYDRLVRDLIERFKQAQTIVPAVSGSLPVIFTPKGVASTLLLPLQSALNGKTVLQGASPLGEKLGQQVFDRRLSLHDDGTVPFRPGSAVVDDEGVPTRRTPLIEGGRVESFYYDLQTAGLAGRESTGNGMRGLGSLPNPSTTNLLFAEGDVDFSDMLADVKEGILVDQVIGAWAGNVLAGEFSASIHLGYKIEKGVITGRVKDSMVAGNVFEALRNQLVAVGAEAVWVGGSLKVPPLYFRAMTVSAKG